jgi:hypothetical protein
MRVLKLDKIEQTNSCECSECRGLPVFVLGLPRAINSVGIWGPLHTQAKSRDHEIVRAQKKVSKGHCPNTPSKIM